MSILKTYTYSFFFSFFFFKQSNIVGKTQTGNLFSNIHMLSHVNLKNQLLRKRKTDIHV